MPYLTVNDHKLHYADSWDPEEKAQPPPLTVVLLHGLGSSQNFYGPILPYLSDHRCIRLDTCGSGRSKYDGKVEQSIETIGKDVLGAMDALEIKQAVIVGHSFGGIVVLHLASTASDRVLGAACIGPVHPTSGAAEVFNKRIQVVQQHGMEPLANTIPNLATSSQSSPLARAFIRELVLSQDPSGYISLCGVIAKATSPDYKAVNAPFLLIAGEEDKAAPWEGCKHIFESVGSEVKRVEILDRVGHWHCVEAGDKVGPIVQEFCGGIKT